MSGEIALDTSMAIRLLNGDSAASEQAKALPRIMLPTIVVGELMYGAKNSARASQNLPRCITLIDTCVVVPLGQTTAALYAQTRLALKKRGKPMPTNDVWIAAQCIEHSWTLVTDDSDFDRVDGLLVERW